MKFVRLPETMPVLVIAGWAVLCLCTAVVVYVYAIFPALLYLFTIGRRYRAPQEYRDDELPTVSVVIAAYNEESVIEEKVRNCLAIDYPRDKIEFFFVSDSTDRTNEILLRHQSDRVIVKILAERRGKLAALNAVFPLCRRDVLAFSDANTMCRPDSIRKLVRHFRDPEVGAVTGDVRLMPSKEKFGQGEGLYYRYERRIQLLETDLWATVGIDGGMYALRRKLLLASNNPLVADDFVTGMNVGRQGFRILYDPEAIADEDPTPSDGMEFRRKIRVVAYAFQSFMEGEGLPRWSQLRFMWVYVSHKLLRWWVPFFLAGALIGGLMVCGSGPLGLAALAVQAAFYLLALLGWKSPGLDAKLVRVPYYFTMVNLAAGLGVLRGLRRKQPRVWARTDRSVPPLRAGE